VLLIGLCILNLLQWRPIFLDATEQAYLRSSGVVPGSKLGRRDSRFSAGGDGEDE
jgi:hypothetical protein